MTTPKAKQDPRRAAAELIEQYGRRLRDETDPEEVTRTINVIETALLVIKRRIGGAR